MHTAIRHATKTDISLLAEVEHSAAKAFLVLPNYIPSNRVVAASALAQMSANGLLWVATDTTDSPIGFIACRIIDNFLYIHEISVAYNSQKQGLGRALMRTVIDHAEKANIPAIGLTTRRHAAWNKPFYETLGFIEIEGPAEWPGLYAVLQKEIAQGADPATRCAMIKQIR